MSAPLVPADTLRVEAYTPTQAPAWNALIANSANGPFLFARPFLDYHQDRFTDHSWLVWQGPKLRAVFVAAVARTTSEPTTLVAHPGLAYGGLVTVPGVKYAETAAMLNLLRAAWQAAGFRHVLVRPVPRVFCRQFSDNQVFWLHQQGAELSNRELNSVLDLTQPVRIGTWRRGNLRKARLHGVTVRLASNAEYEPYWELLTETLAEVHSRQPVHTLAEISRLRNQNPGHLELWGAWQSTEMVAGVLVFQDERQGFAHTQYIAGSTQGKQVGGVDAVLARIIEEKATHYHRLSFGISTVQGTVNPGLLNQKEGFGATAELMETYRLTL
jgi:hypothetical protein